METENSQSVRPRDEVPSEEKSEDAAIVPKILFVNLEPAAPVRSLDWNESRLERALDEQLMAEVRWAHCDRGKRSGCSARDDVSIRSLRLEVALRALDWAGLSLQDDVKNLVLNRVPVQPSCAAVLLSLNAEGLADDRLILAQRFVPRDSLQRIVSAAAKKNDVAVIALLAVDGLAPTSTAPNFDPKRYVDRLRFAADVCDSDEEDRLWCRHDREERAHVRAVRKVYSVLKGEHDARTLVQIVYGAVRDVYGKGLPEVKHKKVEVSPELIERAVQAYVEAMGGRENVAAFGRMVDKHANRPGGKKRKLHQDAVCPSVEDEDCEEGDETDE